LLNVLGYRGRYAAFALAEPIAAAGDTFAADLQERA
jgi:hypothetical protein